MPDRNPFGGIDPALLDMRIPLSEVPGLDFMPRRQGHKTIDARSVRRWRVKGWLKADLIGGAWYTCRRWVIECIERRSESTPADKPSTSENRRAHDSAMRELAAAGI